MACLSSFCRKGKAWRKKASSESRKELQEKSWSVGEWKGWKV